jgi:hypothetical protein
MAAEGIGTFLGDAGACPEIEFEQHIYQIGHPTQRAKACLEELAAAKAVAEIRKLKTSLPADAYSEMFAELNKSIAAGDYRTWGPGWQRIVLAGGNAHLFLLSLMRERNPKVDEKLARALAIAEPEQVGAALARVVPGFFSLLLDELPLQKEQRQAADLVLKEAVDKMVLGFEQPKGVKNPPPPPSPTTPTNAESSTTPT